MFGLQRIRKLPIPIWRRIRWVRVAARHRPAAFRRAATRMKYLCLMYAVEGSGEAERGPSEGTPSYVGAPFWDAAEAATVVGSESTAVTVRVRDGNVLLTEGAASEGVGRKPEFMVIDAKDLNDAIRVASKFPTARRGSVELRPIGDGAS